MKRLFLFAALFPVTTVTLYARTAEQPSSADSVRARIEASSPAFTGFKDNYLIGGTALGHTPTAYNSDIKIQASISQRLTKSTLPFNTYLFFQYTQRVFWQAFRNSLPFKDISFNPGIGIGHLIVHDDRYIGKGYLMLEHESNGKDSLDSRSWNRISLGAAIRLNSNIHLQFKTWYAIIDSRRNKDILAYNGIFLLAGDLHTTNQRLRLGVVLTKRKKSDFSFNSQVELTYMLNSRGSQALFLQYYNGYGETLLEYKQHQSAIRIGFVIKPKDFTLY
ncbi:MAG: phospholipase A [Tannerellaceae bacterium]|nr:phospholipase A [Tannerellaceae bacterium]